MRISDETVPEDSITSLKTIHETAWGMDIIGLRGHKIFYEVTTK